MLDAAGDFGGRGRLLFDRRSNGGGDLVDFVDTADDGTDGRHRILGCRLHGTDCGDLSPVARAVWLAKILHLIGDDRETLARITRPRRFDGGIQRQQIGLTGDVGRSG